MTPICRIHIVKRTGDTVTSHRSLAAVNFTGSVPTFQWLWKAVAGNLNNYVTFPRLIGGEQICHSICKSCAECGGKNFHFVHSSADLDTVAPASIRSAFEYQGQKCSAVSRMYVPQSVWPVLKAKLLEIHASVKVGPVGFIVKKNQIFLLILFFLQAHDSSMFMSAVIDAKAFKRISGHIERAKKNSKTHEIIAGGTFDDSVGYYVQPTIVMVKDPEDEIMKQVRMKFMCTRSTGRCCLTVAVNLRLIKKIDAQEIFGPILPIYIYADTQSDRVLDSLKDATPFGLTGAVFAQDK
jgi:1-pyrroline-5-carboxylate dehydrogenase